MGREMAEQCSMAVMEQALAAKGWDVEAMGREVAKKELVVEELVVVAVAASEERGEMVCPVRKTRA